MSLHLNRQCQRADALPPPVRLVPGIGCTDQEEARNGGESRRDRRRLLEAPYMGGSPARQRPFANFLQAVVRFAEPRENKASRPFELPASLL